VHELIERPRQRDPGRNRLHHPAGDPAPDREDEQRVHRGKRDRADDTDDRSCCYYAADRAGVNGRIARPPMAAPLRECTCTALTQFQRVEFDDKIAIQVCPGRTPCASLSSAHGGLVRIGEVLRTAVAARLLPLF
jgi:hypothetical protein